MNPTLSLTMLRQYQGEGIFSMFLRSLQYGIVVIGLIDAFVDAHLQQRRSIEKPGNFGDCM